MMPATRTEALARLAAFVPRAGRDYRATRNEDRGPTDRKNVSVLAPYIRARLITEEEVIRAVLTHHRLSNAEKFVQEVFWRTYWKGWLESRPTVWSAYRRALDAHYVRLESEEEPARLYEEAIAGRTGIEPFDTWARELVDTGYLHNHARMWFASIWMFTLELPWELGADFFMRHLLCGDPASNTLSWRWVAGLQTKGKTYLARRANIRRYTNERLDPGARLATKAVAIEGVSYAAEALPARSTHVHGGEAAMLVLHDDDAGVDTLPLSALDIRTSLALVAVNGRSPRAMAEPVVSFARGALADGLTRAPNGDPNSTISATDPAAAATALLAHARRHNVRLVVTPYAPVGPVREAFAAIEPLLAAGGLRCAYVTRAWDATAWPHATRGFFNLKDNIPSVLATLGVYEQEL